MDSKEIDYLLSLPDNSITDTDVIRRIGLLSYKRDIDINVVMMLNKKVNTVYSFAGLYPNDIKPLNIKPDV